MDMDYLEKVIREEEIKGHIPFVVVGTAGTTVLAAFDPLDKMADICQAHNVWLHVDGSYGGSCLMSKTHRHLCKGIEKADSVTWNPHKGLHVPFQCSVFLTRHEDILRSMLSLRASYLFQKDKLLYDVSLDTGDMSLQCGRVNDAFKIWLMWKKNGLALAGREIDRQLGLANYLKDRIRERDGFELVVQDQQYTNVCFWYIPPCLRGVAESDDRKQRLNKVAPKLKAGMVLAGSMMICYQPLGDLPNFLRMVTVSTSATEDDMEYILNELERIGASIQV
jgi:glutamate/tyrosine decarboxylase-like PLP-dependent enzyme